MYESAEDLYRRRPQPPAAGLSAPPQLRDTLSTLREIMAVYNSSLLDTDALPVSLPQREAEFKPVLDTALEPALDMCDQMAAMRSNSWDRNVFGVNCKETVLTALEGFGFTATRVKELEEAEGTQVEELTAEHVSVVVGVKSDARDDVLTLCVLCLQVWAFAQRQRSRANHDCYPRARRRRSECLSVDSVHARTYSMLGCRHHSLTCLAHRPKSSAPPLPHSPISSQRQTRSPLLDSLCCHRG